MFHPMSVKQPPVKQGYVCLGVITGARGIRGEVTVKSFCQNESDVFTYGDLVTHKDNLLSIESSGGSTKTLYAKFKEVPDRNAAEKLRGTFLYVIRNKLPKAKKGEVYVSDVTGLEALAPDGSSLGVVDNAFDNGSNGLVLEIGRGAVLLLPEYASLKDDKIQLTETGFELLNLA